MSVEAKRILTLVSSGLSRPDEATLRALEESDKYPRVNFFADMLNSDMLDEKFLQRAPSWRRAVYRFLPTHLAQVLEAFSIRKKYDIVISWSEKLGLTFALLTKLTGARVPQIGLFGWPAKGEKAFLLKHLHDQFDRIFLWSTIQRDKVVNELGVPPSKIIFIKWFVDQNFFRPLQRETDMICGVGSEMRDYPTMIKALEGLDIKCHIAAGTLIDKATKWTNAVAGEKLPPNITVEKKSVLELRELYARSRFVVIPLHQTETDNGITCILEAFAMGKAVICSRTKGQIDVIEEGKTGMFVPVEDPVALKNAILHLWNTPDEAERMGKEARIWIERFATLDGFVHNLKRVVETVLIERGKRPAMQASVGRSDTSAPQKFFARQHRS